MHIIRSLWERFKKQNVVENVRDIVSLLLACWYKRSLNAAMPYYVMGRIRIYQNKGRIRIGARTRLWDGVKLSASEQADGIPATIIIGSECNIGDRTEIHAASSVRIGNRVMISWDCVILDRDYHPIYGAKENFAPVVIEDEVWIGCRAIILKGVTVGCGAIVGAGAVVTKSIPNLAIVAGNPARIIGYRSHAPYTETFFSGKKAVKKDRSPPHDD